MKQRSYIKPISDKQKEKLKQLEEINRLVWLRDKGVCLNCGSSQIYGKPYKTGAHHVMGKGAHPETLLDIRLICLLCINCHGDDANSDEMKSNLLTKMRDIYHYEYPEREYAFFLKETVQV